MLKYSALRWTLLCTYQFIHAKVIVCGSCVCTSTYSRLTSPAFSRKWRLESFSGNETSIANTVCLRCYAANKWLKDEDEADKWSWSWRLEKIFQMICLKRKRKRTSVSRKGEGVHSERLPRCVCVCVWYLVTGQCSGEMERVMHECVCWPSF